MSTRANVSWSLATTALAVFVAGAQPLYAQCPEWEPGFHPGGPDSIPEALAAFDDGGGADLYLAGFFSVCGDKRAAGVARWDGTSWSGVGAELAATATDLTTFDDGGGDDLYLSGYFTHVGGVPADGIARWDGTSWSALGSGLDSYAGALAVYDDGGGDALYATGNFTLAGGVPANRIARWDGTSWSALGSGLGIGYVSALAVHDGGGGDALYVAGSFATAGGITVNGIARWDGTSWSALGGGFLGITCLAAYDDGGGAELYAGGGFVVAGGAPADYVAKWDGTTWSGLGSNVNGTPSRMASFDDGFGCELYVTGTFTQAGTVTVEGCARWNGTGWSAVDPAAGAVRALEVFDLGSGADLYAAGGDYAGGGGANAGIRRLDGGSWTFLGLDDSTLSGPATALHVYEEGGGDELYATGYFATAGGTWVNGIAGWDGTSWSALGGGLTSSGLPGSGQALGSFAGELIVSGFFDAAGGVAADGIASWDGTSWSALGSGLNAQALVSFDAGGGERLYAGGWFTVAGGAPADYVAEWDGTSWSAVGSGLDGAVQVLAVFDDGSGAELYAAGSFTDYLARWDGTSWATFGSDLNGGATRLAVFDDGGGDELYVGGWFTSAGGTPVSNIAKWDGTSWSAVGAGLESGAVALAVAGSGTAGGPALYAAGSFPTLGGKLAKWDGTSWTALAADMDNEPAVLAAFDDGDGEALYASGYFRRFGDVVSLFFGKHYDPCASPVSSPFCFGTDAVCPCGNGGLGDRGCDIRQGTGGVKLDLARQETTPNNRATFEATGFPVTANPAGVVIRGATIDPAAHVAFGDGIRCVGTPVVRLGAASAAGGSSTHTFGHGSMAGSGTFYYQLWFRNTPAMFCTPDAFNLSNGRTLIW